MKSDIQIRQEQIRNNIANSFTNHTQIRAESILTKAFNEQPEDIQKGHFLDAFQYTDNQVLSITKTGKEVRQSLSELRAKYEAKVALQSEKIEQCLDEFDAMPDECVDEYVYSGFKDKIGERRVFSWRKVDELCGGQREECSKYYEYNELVRKCVRDCAEIEMIKLYERHIDESKNYVFKPSQAAVLGF